MKAGRELDALVAKLMGWEGYHDIHYCEDTWYNYCRNPGCHESGEEERLRMWEGGDPPIPGCEGYPPYSTSIAAAWAVVEKMEWWKAENDLSDDGSVMWYFRVGNPPNHKWYSAEAPRNQAPLAICLAALKAVETE